MSVAEETSSADSKKPVILADRPDYVLFGIAVFIWLLPITAVGLMQRSLPGVGVYANDMYRVAALFTTSLKAAVGFYAQIQTEDSYEWETIELRDYGKILMSGNRTRLDKVLADSLRSPRGMKQRQQMAEYAKQKYERQNPDGGEIEALRFLAVLFPVNEQTSKRRGRWVPWPLDKIPEKAHREVSVHYFDGREAVNSFNLNQPKSSPRINGPSQPDSRSEPEADSGSDDLPLLPIP